MFSVLRPRNVYQVNKTLEILLQALKIPVILQLIEIDFLTKYFVENAVNSITEPLNLNIFWGSMTPDPPPPPDARTSGDRFILECLVSGISSLERSTSTRLFTILYNIINLWSALRCLRLRQPSSSSMVVMLALRL